MVKLGMQQFIYNVIKMNVGNGYPPQPLQITASFILDI